jgi:ribonucleoside-diphosphate reductase alpha chain
MTTSIIDYIFRELAVTYLGRNDLAQISEDEIKNSPIDSISKTNDDEEFDEEELYSERIIEEEIRKDDNNKGDITVKRPSSITITATTTSPNEKSKIEEAKLKGYTGDICDECGHATMVRNGTCLKCITCGSTSGCS